MNGKRLALTLAAAAVIAAAPAQAQTTYSCVVGILPSATNNCSGPVSVASFPFGSDQRQVVVDLDQNASWQSLTVRLQVCNSSGMTFHIGDSPTNNGFGGDGGSTTHDAEAQAYNATLQVLRAGVGSGPALSCQYSPPPSTAGCITQDWTITPDSLTFDRSINSSAALDICANASLFDFPPYDEADSEDPSSLYADKLYVGLNRTYEARFDGLGTGTGVQKACFYLSTSATPVQTTITSACGF